MSISSLTLRDLEYIAAVAEHRHFGKAALAMHVSQPALSGQIKKVERFLGVKVFERSHQGVSVTAVGQKIVDQIRVTMEEAEKIAELVQARHEPLSGSFRLGAISTLGPYYLPYIIGPVRKAFPRLTLRLTEGLTDALLEGIKSGTLDAALVSPTFSDAAIQTRMLFTEPFYLAAPKGHALMTSKTLRPSDLRASDMVLLEDGHCLKDQALDLCPTNRRGAIHEYHATSLETIRHLVASGLGYTLMPFLAITDDVRLKGMMGYRAFDGEEVGREVVIAYRKRSSRAAEVEALATFLKKHGPRGTHP